MQEWPKVFNRIIQVILIIAGLAVVVLFMGVFFDSERLKPNQLGQTEVDVLDTGWSLNNSQIIHFPFNWTNSRDCVPYYIEKNINTELHPEGNFYLYLNAYYSDVRVLVDSNVVYEFANRRTRTTKTQGAPMLLVDLGTNDIQGKTLRIEFTPNLPLVKFYKNTIVPILGEESHIIMKIYSDCLFQICVIYFLFFFSIVMVICIFLEKILFKTGKNDFVWLFLASIIATLQLYSQNYWFVLTTKHCLGMSLIELTSSSFLLFPLLVYLAQFLQKTWQKRLARVTECISISFLSFQIIVQFFTPLDMRELLPIQIVVYVIVGVVITLSSFLVLVDKEQRKKHFLDILPYPVCVLPAIFVYMVFTHFYTIIIMEVGIILFLLSQGGRVLTQYSNTISKASKDEMLAYYAYTDITTGMKNLNAYDKAIVATESIVKGYSSFWIVCLKIEVTEGNIEDRMRKISGILRHSASLADGIYRVGLTEFSLILSNKRIDEVMSIEDEIKNLSKQAEVELKIWDNCYNSITDNSLNDMLRRLSFATLKEEK